MSLLALLPNGGREAFLQGLQKPFQEATAIFEQGFSQAKLQGFKITDAGPLPLLASQF